MLPEFSSPELRQAIAENARKRKFDRDEDLIRAGEEIQFIPIVLSGCVRVLRQDEEGREIFLYHLFPGDTCAVSLTCCQTGMKSMIRAVSEEPTEVLMIPARLADDWYQYPEWRAYVGSNYNQRFSQLLQVVDLIAFSHMDEQVLNYLRQRSKAQGQSVLQLTHQQIADELHTHREAITRLLRALEKKGIVKLGRNSIELCTR